MANEYPFDQTSSQPAQAGNVPKEVSDRFMQELGKHFVTTYTLRISDVEALIEAAQITPSLPNAPAPQAVLDSRAAEHAVSQRIPVNERFLFYRDDEGDYIFEGTRSHEHIAAHGATVEEAYRELLGMLGLRADASPVPSQFDPDDFPEPHMEQGERTEITNEIEIRWRKGFVCAGPFIRENARWTPDQADQFADYLRSAAQSAREQITSAPAPSEPELPPLEKREYKDYESQVDDFLVQRQDQLLAALRENQQLRQQVEELQNDLVLSGHERNILKNSLVKCGCKQDTQCLDQWYNERAETVEQQLAQIRKPIDLSEDDIEAATQWCSEIAGESLRKEYIKIDAANRALVRTIAQLRQQVKDVDKSAKSLYLALYQCGVVIEFVPGSPKIRNQRAETAEQQLADEVRVRKEVVAQHATQALDNARLKERITELEHDVAEWSTVANLGNDRIATAKAVGVVFTDPGTTCVNQRAEDAEAKVRGLSARFMCQAELEGGK